MRIIILFWRFNTETCSPVKNGKWHSLFCDNKSFETKIYKVNGKNFFEHIVNGNQYKIYLISSEERSRFNNDDEEQCVVKHIQSIIDSNTDTAKILIFTHDPLRCERFNLSNNRIACCHIGGGIGTIYGDSGLIATPNECLINGYENNLDIVWETYYKKKQLRKR